MLRVLWAVVECCLSGGGGGAVAVGSGGGGDVQCVVGAADGELVLIIHHLAVDGVSWRILLEDLNIGVGAAPGWAVGSVACGWDVVCSVGVVG